MYRVNFRSASSLSWIIVSLIMLIVGWAITPAQAHCEGKHTGNHPHCDDGGDLPPPTNANPVIVYVRDFSIYVANADGSNELLVIQNSSDVSYGDPSWSPDGSKLVFGVRSLDPEVDAGIYTIAMDFNEGNWTGNWGPLKQVASRTGSGYGNPAWHPIDPVIAYDANTGIADDIFLVNADGSSIGTPVNLTNTPNTYERRISWSPDGSQFAAEEWHPDISDVVVYNFDSHVDPPIAVQGESLVRVNTGTPLPVSEDDRPITQGCILGNECIRIWEVSWSKSVDQTDLVAIAVDKRLNFPDRVYDIWCVQVDDPMVAVNLTNNTSSETARSPSWSPDDSQIVASTHLFVQKGKAKVGRYDSSLIKLNLSYGSGGVCPVVSSVNTLLDPDVGEFIGQPDWRR